MSAPPVELHSEAVDEAKAAREWYAQRSPNGAIRFMHELDRGIREIAEHPGAGRSICTARASIGCTAFHFC